MAIRKIAIVAVVLVIVLFPNRLIGSEAVSIQVASGYFSLDGQTPIRLVIRINPKTENRAIRIEWESEIGDSGSSERALEGDNAPKIIDRILLLERGDYTVRVSLLTGGNKVACQAT